MKEVAVRCKMVLALTGVVLVMLCGSVVMAGDDVTAIEKKMWQSWKDQDFGIFNKVYADDYIVINQGGIIRGKTAALASFEDSPCEVRSFKLGEIEVLQLGDDVVILSYEAHQDATCAGEVIPSHVYSSSTWIKKGDRWMAACYTETAASE
jgi:hypothetical protein